MSTVSIRSIVFVFSLACLLGLLWININVVMDKPAPYEPSFIQIFFVMFPVWAYTIYQLRQNRSPLSDAEIAQKDLLGKIRSLLGEPPAWAMLILAVLYGYALYSLYLFMTGGILQPEYENGQYVLHNHGKITTYTEEEYQLQHRLHLRSITGFFMAFFSISTVALAPWRRS